jgi:hypothetical protein
MSIRRSLEAGSKCAELPNHGSFARHTRVQAMPGRSEPASLRHTQYQARRGVARSYEGLHEAAAVESVVSAICPQCLVGGTHRRMLKIGGLALPVLMRRLETPTS